MKHKQEPELKPCPFCGCMMGVLELGGGWSWFGFHRDFCPLEGNNSAWYGRREHMVEEWNKRYIPQIGSVAKRWRKTSEQKQEHGQAKVRRKMDNARRKRS